MIIGFDFQPLVQRASGGEVQWMKGIIRAYSKQFPKDQILLFYPEDFSLELPQSSSVESITADRHMLHGIESEILRSRSVDVLVRSYPTISHPIFPMERQIAVIPDMQFAEQPEFSDAEVLRHRRLAFGRLLSEVGAVATMTEFSRESILRYPWTVCGDVFLMPPAVDLDIMTETSEGAKTNAAWEGAVAAFSSFFFMPANSWPSKNHRRLFEAFVLALPKLPAGTGLVLSGAGKEWPKVLSGFEHLPIRYLGYLSRSEVARLYRRARALVFFSKYEGFGIPLLEAFYFGTPVVCSNIEALVEVGKDAVLSCSPNDVSAMSEQMVRVATDAGLRQALIERGKRRLRSFSWEESAQALHDAIRRVEASARAERPIALNGGFDGRLSVIIDASFNDPAEEAIRAVLSQSHPDWELLVVSADRYRSKELPDDPRVRLVIDKNPNGAVRGATALAMASGDGRIYLRPDCILDKHALSQIAARFREDPASDVIACATVSTGPGGDVLSGWSMPLHPSESIDPRLPCNFALESDLLANLGRDFRTVRPLVAWRRRIEAVESGFDRELPFAFDVEYWLRLMGAGGNVGVINDSLASICVSDDPVGARFWYNVMRDCERIAERRQIGLSKRFFQLLNHRRQGLDPAAIRSRRRLPSVLGWCDYQIYRARQTWAEVAHYVQRVCAEKDAK